MFPWQYNAEFELKNILFQIFEFFWILKKYGFIAEFIIGMHFFEIINIKLILKLFLKNAALKDNISFPPHCYCSTEKDKIVS